MSTVDHAHSKPVRLAGAAMSAALADKWELAGRYLIRLDAECGGEGIATALLAWCDTLAAHATDGASTERGLTVGNLAFARTDTGTLAGLDGVPAKISWAGRLMQARLAMDEDAFSALLDELPDDGALVAEHILAVLNIVTATINGLPRGYALMGRDT